MNKRITIWISAVIVILVSVLGGVWYYAKQSTISSEPMTSQNIETNSTSPVFQNKIAFVKKGDVWVTNEDGSDLVQLTHSSGTMGSINGGEKFYFSPDFHYLEYDTTGTLPSFKMGTITPVDDIIHVLDVNTGNFVETIDGSVFAANNMPDEYPWAGFNAWVGDSQFIVNGYASDYGLGGGTDDIGELLYNLQNYSSSSLYNGYYGAYDRGAIGAYFGILNSSTAAYAQSYSFAVHYPFVFYMFSNASSSVELHTFNIETKQNNIVGVISSASSGESGQIQPNRELDNFLIHETPALSGAGGTLSLYNNGTFSSIYIIPQAQYFFNDTWSFNDNYLSFQTNSEDSSVSTGTIFVVDISSATNPKIVRTIGNVDNDSGFQWTRDNNGIIKMNGSLYLYNPQTGNTTLFSGSSSDPFVF